MRWQAKFYHRIYKENRRLSDEEIDKLPQLPGDRDSWGNAASSYNAVLLRQSPTKG